jgi:hypothetical protein
MHNKFKNLLFKTAVSWKKIPRQQVERKLRFPGKWLLFNCSVNTSEKVTLWFQKNRTSEEKLIYKKITLVSNNVFNITRLTYMDMGYYICRVRRLEKQIFLKISEGKLVFKVTVIYSKSIKFSCLRAVKYPLRMFFLIYILYTANSKKVVLCKS